MAHLSSTSRLRLRPRRMRIAEGNPSRPVPARRFWPCAVFAYTCGPRRRHLSSGRTPIDGFDSDRAIDRADWCAAVALACVARAITPMIATDVITESRIGAHSARSRRSPRGLCALTRPTGPSRFPSAFGQRRLAAQSQPLPSPCSALKEAQPTPSSEAQICGNVNFVSESIVQYIEFPECR